MLRRPARIAAKEMSLAGAEVTEGGRLGVMPEGDPFEVHKQAGQHMHRSEVNYSLLSGQIPGKGLSGLNYTLPNSVTDQAGDFVDIQFSHEPRPVGIGRFHTDSQQGGDVLCGLSLRNQLKHFTFA